MDRAFTKIN